MGHKNGQKISPGEIIELTVEETVCGLRLDVWLTEKFADQASRSTVQKWIRQGCISSPSEDIRSSRKIEPGETYRILIPQRETSELEPVDLNLRVLYEDDQLAVIVKPPGIAVHAGPGEKKVTLVNGLMFLWKNLASGENAFRPGLVHRLDRETEGLLVIARTETALRKLSRSFQKREVGKEYLAWLLATPEKGSGTIDAPIRRHPRERVRMRIDPLGRSAVTHYQVERTLATRKGRKFAFARIQIETGRTHQIRVHMAHLGCPVAGDPLYSRSPESLKKFGMLLLAHSLKFRHPSTNQMMEFSLEIPDRFREFERVAANY